MSLKIYKTRLLEDDNGVFTDIDHYVQVFGPNSDFSQWLNKQKGRQLSKTWNKVIENPKRDRTDKPSQEAQNVVDTLVDLISKKDISQDLADDFLTYPSLYTQERVGKMEDFFYTAKILSILNKDSKIRQYYPKITPDEMDKLRDDVGLTDGDIKPTRDIRKIIIDADKKYATGETTTFKDVFGNESEYFTKSFNTKSKLDKNSQNIVATLAKLQDFDSDENTGDILSKYSEEDREKFNSLLKFADRAFSSIKNAEYDESKSDGALEKNQQSFNKAYRRTQGFSKFNNVISKFNEENIESSTVEDFVKLLQTPAEKPQEAQPEQKANIIQYAGKFYREIPAEEVPEKKYIALP